MQSARPSPAMRLSALLTPTGMYDARNDELGPARALAATLIGGENVALDRLRRIYARQGTGVFVSRASGEVSGVLALLMLNPGGLEAVEAGRFDALEPDFDWIAPDGEEPVAIYAWGIAANTRDAAQTLVGGSWALGEVLPAIPFFVRAATEAGRRLLIDKMGFVPFPDSGDGLLWSGPRPAGQDLAA